jgi:hypothetical protein
MGLYKNYKDLGFTVIFSKLEIIELALREIFLNKMNYVNWRISKQKLDIENIYFPYSLKGGAFPRKFAIWEPKSKKDTTIFFSNLTDGWYTLMNLLTTKYKTEQLSFKITEENQKDAFYSLLYQKEFDLRYVRVMYDNKWEFYQKGILLSFENEKFYKQRIIKNRLNLKILNQYLMSLGFDINSIDFWSSENDAVYFMEERM